MLYSEYKTTNSVLKMCRTTSSCFVQLTMHITLLTNKNNVQVKHGQHKSMCLLYCWSERTEKCYIFTFLNPPEG